MSFDESHGSPPKAASMRTPLGRVRALGASHSGTSDFWRQRLTAVGMVLLIVPVIVVVMMMLRSNHAGADDDDVVGVVFDRIGFAVGGGAGTVGALAVSFSRHGLDSR